MRAGTHIVSMGERGDTERKYKTKDTQQMVKKVYVKRHLFKKESSPEY